MTKRKKTEKTEKTEKGEPEKQASWRDEGIVRVTVELSPQLVAEIRAAGNAKGLKLSHTVRLWLIERAALERQRVTPAAPAPNGAGI